MTMNDTFTLGIVQMASGEAIETNLAAVQAALKDLQGRCDLAIFPEYSLCLGTSDVLRRNARTLAEYDALLAPLVRPCDFACIFGGLPVKEPGGSLHDSLLAFDEDGKLMLRYDKMHLFQYSGQNGPVIDEGAIFKRGNSPQSMKIKGWKIGVSICYDLRFPELYRTYTPADLMLCTSAFLQTTGQAHWSPLIRARAIENQCYFAGVNQCSPKLYGHSLVCDPWGNIISEAGEQPAIVTVTLHKSKIDETRERLPALSHRHPLFGNR